MSGRAAAEGEMNRAVIAVIAVVLLVGGALALATHHWNDNHDAVTQITAQDGTQTLIIHDHDHGGPAGFFFIPLILFGVLFASRAIFFRGRYGGGPWVRNGGQWEQRLTEWHARAHENGP